MIIYICYRSHFGSSANTYVVLLTRGELVDMTTLTIEEYRKGVELNQASDPFGFRFDSPDPDCVIGLTGAEIHDLLDKYPVLTEEDILGLMPRYYDWATDQYVYHNTRSEIFQLAEEMAEARTKTVSPNNKSVTSDTSTNTGGNTSEDSTASFETSCFRKIFGIRSQQIKVTATTMPLP